LAAPMGFEPMFLP